MKYLQKSFSFFLSDAGITQEDWDAIFDKKSRRDSPPPSPRKKEEAERDQRKRSSADAPPR